VTDDPNSVADALDKRAEWHRTKAHNMDDVQDARLHRDHQNEVADLLATAARLLRDHADRLALWQSNTEGAIADAGDLPGDLTAWSAIRRLTAQRDDLADRLALAEAAHLATYETVSRRADAAESRLAALTDAIGDPDELADLTTLHPAWAHVELLRRIAAAVQPPDPKGTK
jgi:hypothetical protein